MATAAIVTRDSLRDMIHTNVLNDKRKLTQIVGRALVVLYKNQTLDEQQACDTKHSNGVGFAGCDAETGTKDAKFFMERGTLMDWMVQRWIRNDGKGYPRICKYHRQLNAAAELKAAK